MAVARQLSAILDAQARTHAFIGGIAMNVWSVPVPTFDIDLCAAIQPEEVPALLRILEAAGWPIEEPVFGWADSPRAMGHGPSPMRSCKHRRA